MHIIATINLGAPPSVKVSTRMQLNLYSLKCQINQTLANSSPLPWSKVSIVMLSLSYEKVSNIECRTHWISWDSCDWLALDGNQRRVQLPHIHTAFFGSHHWSHGNEAQELGFFSGFDVSSYTSFHVKSILGYEQYDSIDLCTRWGRLKMHSKYSISVSVELKKWISRPMNDSEP